MKALSLNIILCFVAAFILLPGQAFAQKPLIVGCVFGVMKDHVDGGGSGLVPASKVPLSPGVTYGWVIKVATKEPAVRWREEFTLPSAPDYWPAGVAVSADRRTSTTERETYVINETIQNFWTVVKGDPAGMYVIHITLEGGEEVTFRFDVKPEYSLQDASLGSNGCSFQSV